MQQDSFVVNDPTAFDHLPTFIILFKSPEDGGGIFLRNVGIHLKSPYGVTTQKTNIDIRRF
jgi:hypothetical protein